MIFSLFIKGTKGGIEMNLRFTGDINFLSSSVSSETIVVPKNDLNGLKSDTRNMEVAWDNDLIPSIVPLAGDTSYVQSQNILITVRMRRAEDAVFHKIGCAEISLAAGASSLPRMSMERSSSSSGGSGGGGGGGSGGGSGSGGGGGGGSAVTGTGGTAAAAASGGMPSMKSRGAGGRQQSTGGMEQQFIAPLICRGVQSTFLDMILF